MGPDVGKIFKKVSTIWDTFGQVSGFKSAKIFANLSNNSLPKVY